MIRLNAIKKYGFWKKLERAWHNAQYAFSISWSTDKVLLLALIVIRIIQCLLPAALALTIRGPVSYTHLTLPTKA